MKHNKTWVMRLFVNIEYTIFKFLKKCEVKKDNLI
jgi:hypothetical protein